MNYFIYASRHFTPHGRYELNKLTSLPMCGFIAQLVEHRTGIAEVTGSNPVEALIFFFQASSFQLLKLENLLRRSFFTLIYNRSSHMNYFIYASRHFTPHGRYELNKLTSLPMCGFIAQLVEHRTGIAEVTGSNPVEALIFFFQASSFQLLKLENLLRRSFFTLIYNRSSHMNYFIYASRHFTPHGRYELNKLTSLPMCGFIAQLVEHRTGIAEVTGSNPVEALIFFFQASSFQLLKLENLLRRSFFTLIYNRSSHMNYFIYASRHFTPHGRYELNKLTSLPMCGFIAQLVEHRTGIAEVTGSNPVEALIFFRLLLSNCLNWKIYCDDHSSL